MNNRLFLLSLLILTLLFGCVSATIEHRANVAQRAKTELIGMSKADILNCAGAPIRSNKSGNLEYFTYIGSSGQVDQHGNVPADSRYCKVTFIFKDNKVIGIDYTGRTGGRLSNDEQCAFVVEKCLSERIILTNETMFVL
jgi:hypothetical protein